MTDLISDKFKNLHREGRRLLDLRLHHRFIDLIEARWPKPHSEALKAQFETMFMANDFEQIEETWDLLITMKDPDKALAERITNVVTKWILGVVAVLTALGILGGLLRLADLGKFLIQ